MFRDLEPQSQLDLLNHVNVGLDGLSEDADSRDDEEAILMLFQLIHECKRHHQTLLPLLNFLLMTEYLDLLKKFNLKLTPPHLAKIFPAYNIFSGMRHHYGLWCRQDLPEQFDQELASYDKVLLMISGVTTGGKDAVRETTERLQPNRMKKLVTATTRQPRPGEVQGVDYYFYSSQEEFQDAVSRGEFIEWVPQGDRLYGLPFQSLTDALMNPANSTNPSPLFCTNVEVTAWSKIKAYLAQNPQGLRVKVMTYFVIPAVSFNEFEKRLRSDRNDVVYRLMRTIWELENAPAMADFLVSNRIRNDDQRALTLTTQAVLQQAVRFLKPEIASQFLPISHPRRVIGGILVGKQKVKTTPALAE